MSGLRTATKNLLRATPVYFPVRLAFLRLFGREQFLRIRRARSLYSTFVSRGDLIFDVGARVGDYTEIFLALGARVLAIEPNPEAGAELRRLKQGTLDVEEVAISDREGWADLHLSQWDDIATLSNDFLQMAKPENACYNRSLRVRVATLDAMAASYGIPRFVKIDTEGFDDKVIQGMSFRPAGLSFEFLLALPNVAYRALDLLGDKYEYNFTSGLQFRLATKRWLSKQEMRVFLERVNCSEGYADVLARLRTE